MIFTLKHVWFWMILSFADELPDCSSLTVLVIAEPVRAANVAEWEARKRDIRLKRSSFKHLEDSPSLRVRITLSCKMSATHNPVCVCTVDREERKHQKVEHSHKQTVYDRACSTHRQMKDIHEDRMAFLRFLIEAGWWPDPVQVGSIWAEVQRGHAAAHREVMSWHGHNLAHLEMERRTLILAMATLVISTEF